MTERRLDEAIDRTVREMMDVDPRPGLSRRVRARLDAPRATWLTLPRLAAGAALVGVAIIAIVLVTRTPAPVPQQVSVAREPGSGAPRVEHVPAPSSQPVERPSRIKPTRASVPAAPLESTMEDIPPFVSTVNVEPLEPIAPIAMSPVEPRSIDPPGIAVRPLAPLEPLRVDPLSSTPH